MKKVRNALVAQSGGPTAAINASLVGVIKGCLDSDEITTVYGAKNGVEGLMDEKLVNLTEIFEDDAEALKVLKSTPYHVSGFLPQKAEKYAGRLQRI